MNKTENKRTMIQDGCLQYFIAEDVIVQSAVEILKSRANGGDLLNSATSVADFLKVINHRKDKERFLLVSLDSRLKVIACDTISTGTVKDAYVHPRDVVTMALKRNASACILSHNHPSGFLEPSQDDLSLTRRLVAILGGMSINVPDHIITADGEHFSFAENGVMPGAE